MNPLHVHVGDVIKQGKGKHAHIVHITWPSNATEQNPIAEAITLVPPEGSGAISGTALNPDFLHYVGFDSDDGHTWEVTVDGYQLVTQPWWETFRPEPTTPAPTPANPQ